MKKHFVKVALYTMPRITQPDKGYFVLSSMTGNPNFPPAETATMLATLKSATDKLQDANAGADTGSYARIAIAQEQAMVFATVLGEVARYVQTKANVDPANSKSIIQSAGFDVHKQREKAKAPSAVSKMVANFTNMTGTIFLTWKSDKYARIYLVYMTETPDVAESWKQVDVLSTRKLMVNGLASGKRYYFKVIAKGLAGSGEPSDIVSQMTA
ncbi:MAG: fibronectin type III domain-containing protein, partial [Bacteroidetes bacterium]|nr:fibronectin type III domain-containing protein [Bacteroidota bacterium]